VYHRHNERDAQHRKHHQRFGMLEVARTVGEELVVPDEQVQTPSQQDAEYDSEEQA